MGILNMDTDFNDELTEYNDLEVSDSSSEFVSNKKRKFEEFDYYLDKATQPVTRETIREEKKLANNTYQKRTRFKQKQEVCEHSYQELRAILGDDLLSEVDTFLLELDFNGLSHLEKIIDCLKAQIELNEAEEKLSEIKKIEKVSK